jgi:hypothetical protein
MRNGSSGSWSALARFGVLTRRRCLRSDRRPSAGAIYITVLQRRTNGMCRIRNVSLVTTNPLDVSLHDADLREELDLTVRLIVAANDSDTVLGQREIDEILGMQALRAS